MSKKIILDIKTLAKEIEESDNINASELKLKLSKLYEKLVVLEFLENSIYAIEEPSVEEEIIVQTTENIADTSDLSIDKIEVEAEEIIVETKITETVEVITKEVEEVKEEIITSEAVKENEPLDNLINTLESKKSSLHEELKKNAIQIGLNDRIAFVKRLFNGNQQDFHRVLSQVNTFSTIDEVKEFIDTMVKPEHNWDDQDEYAERFMEIIELKFQ